MSDEEFKDLNNNDRCQDCNDDDDRSSMADEED